MQSQWQINNIEKTDWKNYIENDIKTEIVFCYKQNNFIKTINTLQIFIQATMKLYIFKIRIREKSKKWWNSKLIEIKIMFKNQWNYKNNPTEFIWKKFKNSWIIYFHQIKSDK